MRKKIENEQEGKMRFKLLTSFLNSYKEKMNLSGEQQSSDLQDNHLQVQLLGSDSTSGKHAEQVMRQI